MDNIKGQLLERAGTYGIPVSDPQAEMLQRYMELLVEWNQKLNLTAITEPKEVAEKHFIDSMMIMKAANLENKTLIDVGTGAGFPGLVLKILCPSLKVTLLDSLNKRLVFLDEVIKELGLIGIETIHGRAEEISRKKEHRDSYDYSVSRAVARLSLLSEYCLPYVKPGGSFLAMKGPAAEEELQKAGNAIKLLGGCYVKSYEYNLSGGEERVILQIDKIASTDKRFPRTSKAMARKDL